MSNTPTFDPYEYIAIITPGAVVAAGVAFLWPEARSLLAVEGVSLGDLGLFMVAAFVAGHLGPLSATSLNGCSGRPSVDCPPAGFGAKADWLHRRKGRRFLKGSRL